MAGGYDGTIHINTQLDTNGFSQGVSQMHSGLNSVLGSIKGLTSALGVGLSLAGLVAVGKQAVELASDLQEVQNVVDTAFRSMSYKMEEFAATSVKQFGLSKLAAKQMGSTFMAMASNMIPSMERASDMSIALTGRAADMASFYNKTAKETATALNAVFTGESEALKQYGVIMTEVNLQQYAYQQGINKTLDDMTQAEKVQLRYNYVMEQTSLAAGDFAKTSDSWANQTRILSEQFKELLSILGSGLIQVLTPAIRGLNTVLSELIEIANAIGTIMSKLLGLNSVKLSSSGQSAADGFASATDSVEDYTDAVDKASKESKGSVAGFDELTMLQSKAAAGSGTDISFETSGLQTELVEGESHTEEISKQLEKVLDYINQLSDAFKKGFVSGLKDADGRLSGILEDLQSIRDSVFAIFEDGTVADSFGNMGLRMAESLGKVTGSISSIGETIAENLIGGVDYALQEDGDRIKEFLVSMFDIYGEIAVIVGEFSTAIANIFSVFGDENAQRLTGAIYSCFSNIFMEVNELAARAGRDILDALTRPIIENQDGIKGALDKVLGVMADNAETIRDTIVYAFEAFNSVYDEHIAPLIDSIGSGLSYLVSLFLEFWNTHVQPLLEEWSGYFAVIMEENIRPLIDAVMLLLGSLINLLQHLWNDVLMPFLEWVITNILPKIMPIFTGLGRMVKDFLTIVTNIITDVITIFSGLIDFFVGIFSGDWQTAWDGLVNIVKGCINLVIDCINGMINALFVGINAAVDLINGLLEKIPESVKTTIGFSQISHFTPPQIPRLATGTVVPPGMSQFMAILGDNNKETEVVSPLSTMKEAVIEAIYEMGGFGQNGETVINIDGKEVFRVMREQNKEYKKMTGQSAFV